MIYMTGDLLMTKRRKFSREFKLAAVKKIVEKGLSPTEVARDLGISGNSIYNWKRSFLADGTISENERPSTDMEAENKRLRDEVRQLKMERDILKKATAFFAKESN
jgi:transposase